MWVSLHQNLKQLTPHGGQGLFGLMGYQEEPLHRICMPLILGLHDAGIGEQRRYCVKRSKQQYRDLDSQPVSQDGETKQEKTEVLTHTLLLTRCLSPWCACEG